MAPRGSPFLIVESLSDRQKTCAEPEWVGFPTVPAKTYEGVAKSGASNGRALYLIDGLKIFG